MNERYTSTAIALHWLVFVLILAAFPLGLYMHDLPVSPTRLRLYSYHKWIGVSVFLFALIRTYWRITHFPPALPQSMKAWERQVAQLTHIALYLLIIIVPLSGWLMSSAKGFQTVWFGVLPLPDLVGKDKALGKLLENVHSLLNYTMLALIVAHITAALKHQFINRDSILQRMLPARRT